MSDNTDQASKSSAERYVDFLLALQKTGRKRERTPTMQKVLEEYFELSAEDADFYSMLGAILTFPNENSGPGCWSPVACIAASKYHNCDRKTRFNYGDDL